MSLKVDTREVSHVTVLDIHGRIILGPEIGTLRTAVRNLIAENKKKIILNLAGVDYLDSSGVGELVSCFTTVRSAGGELKLLNLTQKVHDVLHVTKLYRLRHQRRRIHRRKILRLLLREVSATSKRGTDTPVRYLSPRSSRTQR
jgi:anti-sigma B factor antagonist